MGVRVRIDQNTSNMRKATSGSGKGSSGSVAMNLRNSSSAGSRSTYFTTSAVAWNNANFVAGRSSRGMNRYNYQPLRAQLNQPRRPQEPDYRVNINVPTPSFGTSYGVSNNWWDVLPGAIKQGGELAVGILDGIAQIKELNAMSGNAGVAAAPVANPSNTDTLDGALNSISGGGSSSSSVAGTTGSFIDGMSNAKDSESLRTALAAARDEATRLEGTITTETQEVSSLPSESTLESDLKTAEETHKDNQSKLKQEKTTLESFETKARVADEKVQQCKTDIGRVDEQISGLETSITDLSNKLNSAPDEAKPAIQAKLDSARAQLTELKNQKEALNKELKKLEGEAKKAHDDVDKSKNEKIPAAEEKVEESAKEVQEKKTAKEDAAAKRKSLKNHQSELKKLKEKCDHYQKELDKMVKNEEKQYQKYDNKADTKIKKAEDKMKDVDSENMSLIDKIHNRSANRKLDSADKKQANRDGKYTENVYNNDYIKMQKQNAVPEFSVGGSNYYKVVDKKGNAVYYEGNNIIGEYTFNQAKQKVQS